MDNVIPQTAEISRSSAKIEVQYDGAPQFSPIQNTSLAYAENTASQVIRDKGMYFACEDGVWYVAPSPAGPWSVSDTRPAGIEGIPPSSPVYNTKYVYIYDSTPDFVYVGYLPGYRWSFPYHGVVYYGTGWRYRGWYRRYYYPRPTTWGFFPRYNPWTGWSFGMSWTPGWLGLTSNWGYTWAGWSPVYGYGYRPGFWSGFHSGGWFGPGGYRPPRPPYWRPPGRPAPGRPTPGRPATGRPVVRPGNNLYNRPGNAGTRPHPDGPRRPGRPAQQPGGGGQGRDTRPPARPSPVTKPDPRRPNNVYADREGNLHRNRGGNWQIRQEQTWKPEGSPKPSRPAPPAARPAPQPAPAHSPQPRPTIRTEPRGGGSVGADRDARNRGTVMAPRGGQRNRGN